MTTRVGPSYQYNALCDGCGFKKKNHEIKRRWDGLMMCSECWEPRHPMDFYKSRNDVHKLPWTRSDNNGIDVSPTVGLVCTVVSRAPIADQGVADCMTITS